VRFPRELVMAPPLTRMYGHAAEPFTRERKMADLTYVAEKFHIAVYALVKNGTPNKRLHDAYMPFIRSGRTISRTISICARDTRK
jgi:hypothetical protein